MPGPHSTFRILIVDDNEGDVRLLIEAIMESGAPILVVSAKSGPDAMALLGNDPYFDLILSDLNMPRMSGVEMFIQLQQQPEIKNIPMAIMSSSQREKLPARVLERLSVPYFVKADSWTGFVRLAREIHFVLTDGKAEDSGRRLAELMTPPAGFPKFSDPKSDQRN